MDWENHLEKSRSKKSKKTVKIVVKLPHVNKKPLARKRIFVQTPFSHSTSDLEQKSFTPQNHSLFRSTSCLGVTKITTPIWLQKSWNVWTDLKKKHSRKNSGNDSKEKIAHIYDLTTRTTIVNPEPPQMPYKFQEEQKRPSKTKNKLNKKTRKN